MPLTSKQVDQFRRVLMEERGRLQRASSEHRKNNLAIEPEELVDETDMASSQINQHLVFRIRDRERILLRKIDKALERIDGGNFGECEECSDEIELNRLKARPVATLCIKCKEEQEHRESQTV